MPRSSLTAHWWNWGVYLIVAWWPYSEIWQKILDWPSNECSSLGMCEALPCGLCALKYCPVQRILGNNDGKSYKKTRIQLLLVATVRGHFCVGISWERKQPFKKSWDMWGKDIAKTLHYWRQVILGFLSFLYLFGPHVISCALRHQRELTRQLVLPHAFDSKTGKSSVCYRFPWRNGLGWCLMRRGGGTRGSGGQWAVKEALQPFPPTWFPWAPWGQQQPQASTSSSPSAQR